MKQQSGWLIGGIAAMVLALNAHTVMAQDAPPPPPPGEPGGPGGFGGPGGPGGRGGFGQRNRTETLATAPLEALKSGLKLTDEQAETIKTLQASVRPQGGGFGGPRGGQGGQRPQRTPGQDGGPGGGRPDFAAMQEKEKTATKDIEAVLTDSQKRAVPGVLKDIQTLRSVNIPAELIGSLNLTSEQKTRLTSIASRSQSTMQKKMQEAQESGDFQSMRETMQSVRADTDKQVKAVLTASQNALVEKFRADNPQRGFGGPGGGPGGRGGFGGPGGPGGPGGGPGGPGGPPEF